VNNEDECHIWWLVMFQVTFYQKNFKLNFKFLQLLIYIYKEKLYWLTTDSVDGLLVLAFYHHILRQWQRKDWNSSQKIMTNPYVPQEPQDFVGIFHSVSVRVTTFNAHVWDPHKHTRLYEIEVLLCYHQLIHVRTLDRLHTQILFYFVMTN